MVAIVVGDLLVLLVVVDSGCRVGCIRIFGLDCEVVVGNSFASAARSLLTPAVKMPTAKKAKRNFILACSSTVDADQSELRACDGCGSFEEKVASTSWRSFSADRVPEK